MSAPAMIGPDGLPIRCGHKGCNKKAVRIISHERPNHREFQGQTHDCCAKHSRETKHDKTS